MDISSRGFVVSYLCPFLVREFHGRFPEVSLRFLDQSPEATEASARENLVNTIFHFGDAEPGKNWLKTKVGQVSYGLFVRQDHPLGKKIDIEQLKKYRLVGGVYIEKKQLVVAQMLKPAGHKVRRGYDSENSIYTKQILQNSNQVGYLPQLSAYNEVEQGLLRPIQVNGWQPKSRALYLEVHQDRITQAIHKKLIEVVQEALEASVLKTLT